MPNENEPVVPDIPAFVIGSIPTFWGWTTYTPVIPKLYWDVYSQEERIKRLCVQYDKLCKYVSGIAALMNQLQDDVNDTLTEFEEKINKQLAEQDEAIQQQLAAQDAKVTKQLNDMFEYIKQQFEDIAEGQLTYDVTTGKYRPSVQAMRRLFQALSFDHKGTTQLVSYWGNKTVSQMAAGTVYHTAYSDRQRITIDDQN